MVPFWKAYPVQFLSEQVKCRQMSDNERCEEKKEILAYCLSLHASNCHLKNSQRVLISEILISKPKKYLHLQETPANSAKNRPFYSDKVNLFSSIKENMLNYHMKIF